MLRPFEVTIPSDSEDEEDEEFGIVWREKTDFAPTKRKSALEAR